MSVKQLLEQSKGKTIEEVEKMCADELKQISCLSVQSSDGKLLPMNLYWIIGYPLGWKSFTIKSMSYDWEEIEKDKKEKCLTVVIDKTKEEIDRVPLIRVKGRNK